jgi:protein-tyrosine phosphatase
MNATFLQCEHILFGTLRCEAGCVSPQAYYRQFSSTARSFKPEIATMANALKIALMLVFAASAPALHAAPPAGAMVTRNDQGNLVVTWTDANPVDVFASSHPDAKFTRSGVVSANDADGQEVLVDNGSDRRFFLLRDRRTGEATRVAERILPLAQGSNFRDIGGYQTASGRHVKWGMIYRSGATPLLSDADVIKVKALGLVDMIDLRSSEERLIAPTRLTGIRYTAIDYSMMSMMSAASAPGTDSMITLYRTMPKFLAPHLRIVFSDLINHKGPILYHCSAGQDRTGVTTAIILSALGVPRDTIIADYHLSTTYRRPEFEMPVITPAMAEANPVARMFAGYQKAPGASIAKPLKTSDGKAFLEGALAEIDTRWGSVDGFLTQEIGLTRNQISLLRKTYTE